MQYSHDDLEQMARTIWGEARGESLTGQAAVAWVIRNRATRHGYAGSGKGLEGDITRVCHQPWQFSCWNVGDPNLPKMSMVHEFGQGADQFKIARAVLDGQVADISNGADLYYVTNMADPPEWSITRQVVAVIGAHTFLDSRIVLE